MRALLPTGGDQAAHSVRRLIHGRLAVLVVCACAHLLGSRFRGLADTGQEIVYALLGGLALLNLGWSAALGRWPASLSRQLLLQFAVDLIGVTLLAHLTGGLGSAYTTLYFVAIVASSLLTRRRQGAFFASLAAIGLALVTAAQLTGAGQEWVDPAYRLTELTLPAKAELLRRMLLFDAAFFVLAYLSGLLADRLETARSLNEEILQHMAEGVALFDAGGRLAFFNPEFERLFSPRRALQLGDRAEAVLCEPEEAPLRAFLSGGAPGAVELSARDRADCPRPAVEMRASLLGGPEAPHGTVLIAIDLSLRHRADLAERQAARFSAVTEMAAALAHEIRNPLASVRGSLQEIGRDIPENHPNRKLAGIVIRESDRLDRIITSFLQFARQRPLRPMPQDLGAILEEVVMLLRQRPDAAGVKIELHREPVPVVRCDPDQARELFLNLGVNALEAMGGKGTLVLRCPHADARPSEASTALRLAAEEGVVVSVSDDGPGLPADLAERVFEPFFTTKSRGSGLGLAVVRRIAEAHAGEVWVRSRPGEGAAFHCWLPRSGPFQPGAPIA